ncbi:MAG: DNA-binding response regulator [Myxococcota bacterium]
MLDTPIGGAEAICLHLIDSLGLGVLDRLVAADSERPIITTGSGEFAAQAIERGAYDFISTTDTALFRCRIAHAVERRRLTEKVRNLSSQLASNQSDDDEVVPLRELEREAIGRALRATKGSVTKAAKLLGIGRATLYRRLASPEMASLRPRRSYSAATHQAPAPSVANMSPSPMVAAGSR